MGQSYDYVVSRHGYRVTSLARVICATQREAKMSRVKDDNSLSRKTIFGSLDADDVSKITYLLDTVRN